MFMKILKSRLLVVVLLCSFCFTANGQGNKNFFKLFVTNDKNEVMLIKYGGEWEIPGASYGINESISAFLDTMAMQHGITIRDKKLAAQITFHHEIRDNPTIMLYYTASYKSGALAKPEWGDEVKWVPLKEAYSIIPYPEMVYIMKQFKPKMHDVWGGAFKITYDKETNKRIGYEVMEDLYRLN